MDAAAGRTAVETGDAPAWRTRALARGLGPARTRAGTRAQRYLDAAFTLIDEKGTTEFTIQEVVDESGQSLRSFYDSFAGKNELVLALLEEIVVEAVADLRRAVDAATDPLDRLRACVVRLHEWCDPFETPRRRGRHHRRAISELSMQLAADHAPRVRATLAPVTTLLTELVTAADVAGAVQVADARRTAVLVQQTVLYSWFGNRLVDEPDRRVSADETWDFCRFGLGGSVACAS